MLDEERFKNRKQMVRWFDPSVLVKVLYPVIISKVFGEYGDRRLVHAALDPAKVSEYLCRSDIRACLKKDEDEAIWFDYAADTGDGFNSTFSVAYSLAQDSLELDQHQTERGSLLVMGGDQVYPDAARSTYNERFFDPFSWAMPDQEDVAEKEHPLLYVVPGNHDWYDGLTLFLAFFCKRERQKVGHWRVPQSRSYFALQLSHKWWLWGVDIGLSEDVDQPQDEYFRAIANEMPQSSKLIICTAAPGWQYNQVHGDEIKYHRAYGSLGHYATIAREANRDIEIPLVLSGDTHHYSRYFAEKQGTQFITAGGGGAFLHPTHHLPAEMGVKAWWFRKMDTIRQAQIVDSTSSAPSSSLNGSEHSAACYPSQSKSRQLLWPNLWFALRNRKFSAVLGLSYAILGMLMVMWNEMSTLTDIFTNPFWIAALLFYGIVFWGYADSRIWINKGKIYWRNSSPKIRKLLLAASHTVPHIVALTLLTSFVYWLGIKDIGLKFWSWSFNFYFAGSMITIGGLIAGTIFGVYLLVTCRILGCHPNDAFSNMSMDTYKNFVRIRVKGDKLTVYPIGMDTVPKDNQWELNKSTGTKRKGSWVIPKSPLSHRLIEGPLEIS
ncbi:metallophosphoesterase [Anderseniella sp. Alg231-50]|uniref:metallophosphoesterase n=1 Tax=Anderseniella sp. Alg231-50 TaxID=1922226 RepID=UPI000D5571D6